MKTLKVFCATLALLALASAGHGIAKKAQRLDFQAQPTPVADVNYPPHFPLNV